MATVKTLQEIKKIFNAHKGKEVRIITDTGRRKKVEQQGRLYGSYPCLFIAEVLTGNKKRKLSFSYTDVLTEKVVVTLLENDVRLGLE